MKRGSDEDEAVLLFEVVIVSHDTIVLDMSISLKNQLRLRPNILCCHG